MIKFVTLKNVDRTPLNDQGRPWSCSIFGRSLLNSLCVFKMFSFKNNLITSSFFKLELIIASNQMICKQQL